MKFTFDVGNTEKFRVEFQRDPLLGKITVRANGNLISPGGLGPLTAYFDYRRLRRYRFVVGEKEQHEIVIERERPLLLAGFRRQKYRVLVDGQLIEEHYGY